MRENLKDLTKQYDKSENDLKALQSVGQVGIFLFPAISRRRLKMGLSVGRCIELIFCERNSFNLFETMQMFCSWRKDVHVVWALS